MLFNGESSIRSVNLIPQIGVTYASAERRPIQLSIRSIGVLEPDQAKIFEYVARVDGYIQDLKVTSPGEPVNAGEPLVTIYSPDRVVSSANFLIDAESRIQGALKTWDVESETKQQNSPAAPAQSQKAPLGQNAVPAFQSVLGAFFKPADPKMPVARVTQDGVTVSILSSDGEIHAKENALKIKFQDPGGHPVDAENVKLELNMSMPGMVMHSGAKIKKDDGMGDYQAHLTPDMAGDWSVDLSYQGPQGPTKLKVPVNVKQ